MLTPDVADLSQLLCRSKLFNTSLSPVTVGRPGPLAPDASNVPRTALWPRPPEDAAPPACRYVPARSALVVAASPPAPVVAVILPTRPTATRCAVVVPAMAWP